MPAYTEVAERARDQVRSAIEGAQSFAVSTVGTVSKAVGRLIPQLPSLPFSERLPTPKEVVNTTFELGQSLVKAQQSLLKAQRSYALDIVKALEPITTKVAPDGKARRTAKARAGA